MMECRKCGSKRFGVMPNKKNSAATDLYCLDCGVWQKFATKDEIRLYNDKKPTITNDERISNMNIEEKAEFLYKLAYARETPWSEQFSNRFCKSCPTTKCEVSDYSKPMYLHECDFSDGECPHGSDIMWWLQQPAEGDS